MVYVMTWEMIWSDSDVITLVFGIGYEILSITIIFQNPS